MLASSGVDRRTIRQEINEAIAAELNQLHCMTRERIREIATGIFDKYQVERKRRQIQFNRIFNRLCLEPDTFTDGHSLLRFPPGWCTSGVKQLSSYTFWALIAHGGYSFVDLRIATSALSKELSQDVDFVVDDLIASQLVSQHDHDLLPTAIALQLAEWAFSDGTNERLLGHVMTSWCLATNRPALDFGHWLVAFLPGRFTQPLNELAEYLGQLYQKTTSGAWDIPTTETLHLSSLTPVQTAMIGHIVAILAETPSTIWLSVRQIAKTVLGSTVEFREYLRIYDEVLAFLEQTKVIQRRGVDPEWSTIRLNRPAEGVAHHNVQAVVIMRTNDHAEIQTEVLAIKPKQLVVITEGE
ncbi:hypothetical protein HGA91_05650 [candidate division WWE3 bacterium]|nr:hypothetical protein [candidate division WWE3 bacterium]